MRANLAKLDHVSFSSVKVLLGCKQKFYLRYFEKLKIDRHVDYMTLGKILDLSLENAKYGTKKKYDAVLEEKGLKLWDLKNYYLGQGYWDNGLRLFSRMFQGEEVRLQREISFPLVDLETGELLMTEKDKPMAVSGYIDAESMERFRIYEVKLVSSVTRQTIEEYAFGGQTQLYAHSLMEEYGREDVPEVYYIFLKKPAIRLRKNESEIEFYLRLVEAVGAIDPIIVPITYRREMILETVQYYHNSVSGNALFEPVKNRSECINFGNKCEYFDECWKDAFQMPEEIPDEDQGVA